MLCRGPAISLEEVDPEMMMDPYIDIDAVMAAAYEGVEEREVRNTATAMHMCSSCALTHMLYVSVVQHVDLSHQRDRYREPSLAHVARAEEITLSQVTPTPQVRLIAASRHAQVRAALVVCHLITCHPPHARLL